MPIDVLASAKRVIVADDTAFVRDRFRTALEDAGHRPTTVANSVELVTRVRASAGDIDLVVLDLRLPQAGVPNARLLRVGVETQGIELVRTLRRIDGFRAPIVVFSGTIANAGEVRELSALGVAGYVNEYTAVQHIVPSLSPHLFPDNHNRRSSPRVVLGISVSYRVGNTIAAAVTLNISHGGLAVRTTSPPEPGTELKIRFKLPGGKKEIDGEARVAWTDRRMGMGLQFTRLDADDQASVDEFVQGHFFSNRRS